MAGNKYVYSQLSAEFVAILIASHYDVLEPLHCKYYVLGLHDNYLFEDQQGKYILRIYRNDWRTFEDVRFELSLLDFLKANECPVAHPIPLKNGQLYFSISSPEGDRAAALFPYAEGVAPGNNITILESKLLGKAVANIHSTSDSYKPKHSRLTLDIDYLLDKSVHAIRPFLDSSNYAFISALQEDIKKSLPELPRDYPYYGICIGDVNLSNFHINEKQQITLFDFDQCGYGHRIFEIGKFISSIQTNDSKHKLTEAFLIGYQQVRKLSDDELYSLPYYVKISLIWVMAIHAYNANRIGHKWLEKPFWDARMTQLKALA